MMTVFRWPEGGNLWHRHFPWRVAPLSKYVGRAQELRSYPSKIMEVCWILQFAMDFAARCLVFMTFMTFMTNNSDCGLSYCPFWSCFIPMFCWEMSIISQPCPGPAQLHPWWLWRWGLKGTSLRPIPGYLENAYVHWKKGVNVVEHGLIRFNALFKMV